MYHNNIRMRCLEWAMTFGWPPEQTCEIAEVFYQYIMQSNAMQDKPTVH